MGPGVLVASFVPGVSKYGVSDLMADRATFTIFVDLECPLCVREVRLLRRLDRKRGALRFENIADPEFDAAAYERTRDDFMGTIHGQRAEGTIITGVEVFRAAYRAVGLGWLVAPTAWPGVRQVLDRAYAWFARNRLRLTRRCAGGRCYVGSSGNDAPPSGRTSS